MRDILVSLIVLVGCFYTFKRPYIGILLWSWLSYMNPHRLCYGFAYTMPFAQLTALTLLIAMFFSKETKKLPINKITLTWIVFVLFMGLTTTFAFFFDDAMTQYIRVVKIQLIVFLTMLLINNMVKLNELLWVIVLSIGYYSTKGGLFTLVSGGGDRVWGPAQSFIEGNNELAIASLMIIPLMAYLHQVSQKKWVKNGLLLAIGLSFISALGSQSRGALVAFAAVVFFFWTKSDRKVFLGVAMALLVVLIFTFMPESWHQRMETINTYEEDASAMGRLNAWEYAYNAANDNLLGVGFDSWSPITFAMYAPNPNDVHAAHSIYFSVLADHGWIGLLMFILIFFWSWRELKVLIKTTSNKNPSDKINLLARMMQVSLIAYLVGGAFLSLSYFDLPWHVLSFIQILSRIMKESDDLSVKNMQRL